jgi:hypothetical protein
MRRFVSATKVVLAVLALALPAGLSSCFVFKGTLTIYNDSTHDLDLVQWADDWGTTVDFGDDPVWDATLAATVPGILHGSSSTRRVFGGTDYIYFSFADQYGDGFRRTVEPVTVGGFDDVSFTFTNSTPSITLQFLPSRRTGR